MRQKAVNIALSPPGTVPGVTLEVSEGARHTQASEVPVESLRSTTLDAFN